MAVNLQFEIGIVQVVKEGVYAEFIRSPRRAGQ
jgi:hypothetical protein